VPDLHALLTDNQLFQGGFVLMVLGGALAYLRYAPKLVGRLIQRWGTATLHVRQPRMVEWIGEWLADSDYAERCRRLDASLSFAQDTPRAVMAPGIGYHVFRYKGKWVLLEHAIEDSGSEDNPFIRRETITLKMFGRRANRLREIVTQAVDMANERRRGKQVAFINNGYGEWMQISASEPRKPESVVLPGDMREEILGDAAWFLGAFEWHQRRGLPYRRGYLFHGPPGNGKSTMIQVLAGRFDLPIYVLSLTEDNLTDSRLVACMARVPSRAVVAIEDADKVPFSEKSGEGVTMAGLLNAIDGVLASSGRLLVMTANDISGLPEPLLRPGRIDRRWLFSVPDKDELSLMFTRFFPEGNGYGNLFASQVAGQGLPMSAIQQHLARHQNGEEAIEGISLLTAAPNGEEGG